MGSRPHQPRLEVMTGTMGRPSRSQALHAMKRSESARTTASRAERSATGVLRPLILGVQAALGRLWRPDSLLLILILGLLLLPLVMLQSLSQASAEQMKLQAQEISTLASSIRSFYADNIVARLQAADGKAVFSENYRNIHGGIPIPATLSIELGALFDNAHEDGRISYEFVSDYPFTGRDTKPLDQFEKEALVVFRKDPRINTYSTFSHSGIFSGSYRLATPVIMRKACVSCHNSHPDSTKRDWKDGDIRGLQEVTIRGMRVDGFGNLNSILTYSALLASISLGTAYVFQKQNIKINNFNSKLIAANQRESALSAKMSDQLRELKLLGAAVDNSVVGIAIADMRRPDAPLVYVNDAFCEITGYPRELAVGYNCRFLQGPETNQDEVDRLREAIRKGEAYSGVLLNYRKDGSKFWNKLTLSPVGIDTSGKPDFFVANQVDVSSIVSRKDLDQSKLLN